MFVKSIKCLAGGVLDRLSQNRKVKKFKIFQKFQAKMIDTVVFFFQIYLVFASVTYI